MIRLATRKDADAIAFVLAEAFAEYRPFYTCEGFHATTPDTERIRNRWNEGPVWVATQQEKVVGTVSVAPRGQDLYVRSMALLPAVRGMGLGLLLLQEVERYALNQNFRRMYLSTTPFLDRAIRLYELFGFERTGDGPHHLHGTPLFTMKKSLKTASFSRD